MFYITDLVSEAVGHWLLCFRDNALWTLQETRGVEGVFLALPFRLHDQLRLAERVGGGGVRGDRLDDDAVAGAEAVRLRREHKGTSLNQQDSGAPGLRGPRIQGHQDSGAPGFRGPRIQGPQVGTESFLKRLFQTDRQAVKDDVFVWRRRRAGRQGNGAVTGQTEREALAGGQAERQALTGRGLEVVGPRGAGGLQVERLRGERKRRRRRRRRSEEEEESVWG